MKSVQMPDGAEIQFPADTSEEIMHSVASDYWAKNQTQPTNVLARTGRIATNIAGNVADLPVVVGQAGYDFTRGIQQLTGSQVAPPYKVPLPSDMALSAYDSLTNNTGKATGLAGNLDKTAAFVGPLLPAIAETVPQLVSKALPKIEETTRALAMRAKDFNIPLSMDQVAPNRVRNTIQKVSQEVPFSGTDQFQQKQSQIWHQEVAKTIGQDSTDLGPQTIQNYLQDSKGKFNTLLAGENLNIDKEDVNAIRNISEIAPNSVGVDSLSVVNNNVRQALKDIKAGGISGEKLANIRSSFLENAANADGGAKKFINKIVDSIDNIATKNLSEDKLQELATARKEYRNYKTLEPLLEKSTNGQINPTELLNTVKSSKYIKASRLKTGQDDLVDLARIGKQFLVKKGGSDTFQKSVLGGGLGTLGVTALTNPTLALKGAGLAGAGMAINRGYQGINRSQSLLEAALNARSFNPELNTPLTALTASSLVSKRK